MIGRTCGAAGETMSSERGGICFVCFGVLRIPSILRAALGSKPNISLNALCVHDDDDDDDDDGCIISSHRSLQNHFVPLLV